MRRDEIDIQGDIVYINNNLSLLQFFTWSDNDPTWNYKDIEIMLKYMYSYNDPIMGSLWDKGSL